MSYVHKHSLRIEQEVRVQIAEDHNLKSPSAANGDNNNNYKYALKILNYNHYNYYPFHYVAGTIGDRYK